jgi:hypothetical protein
MKEIKKAGKALAVIFLMSLSAKAQYINNTLDSAQTANFWISGVGHANNGLWLTKHGADVPITGIRITNPSGMKGVNFQLTDSTTSSYGFSTWLYNGSSWIERMRIVALTGNMGIGTAAPVYKLDILDTSTVKYAPDISALALPKGSVSQVANISPIDGGYAGILLTTRNSSSLNQVSYIGAVSNTGSTNYSPDIVFGIRTGPASHKEVMRITGKGNVGIGTAVVGTDYKLAVAGTIAAQKLKITSLGWADFVFDPKYKLPSLNEIEQFVKTHKHLPDVPSAEDVKKDGIDVGSMDKILLQKIEELTLYLINEHTRNDELQQQVKAMQAEIATMKENK